MYFKNLKLTSEEWALYFKNLNLTAEEWTLYVKNLIHTAEEGILCFILLMKALTYHLSLQLSLGKLARF